MFLKYIALTHKASLFNMISYDDVLRMYGKYWFVFQQKNITTLSWREKIRVWNCAIYFASAIKPPPTTTLHQTALNFFVCLQLADDLQCFQP